VCKHINIRKFYVYNLVIRGYAAFGIANLTEQPADFWRIGTPSIVILWSKLRVCEDNLQALHQHFDAHIPVIVISREVPSRGWMHEWQVAAYLRDLSDGRELFPALQPWLDRVNIVYR